jgi:hypothetical protein
MHLMRRVALDLEQFQEVKKSLAILEHIEVTREKNT